MVSDLEKSDAGAYACVVEGVSGNRASGVVARVSVQEPPLLEQTGFLLPSSLREGLRWHSLCSVTRGDPPVSLEWLRDGRLLLPSSPAPLAPASVSPADVGIHVLHVTPFSSTLNFDRLRREHRGNYTCRASNRAGVASITRSLDVHGTLLSSLASASLLLTIASLSCSQVAAGAKGHAGSHGEESRDGLSGGRRPCTHCLLVSRRRSVCFW